MNNQAGVSVVITAAGNGTRFGANKMLALIQGKPVLFHTLTQFRQANKVGEIIIAARKKDFRTYQEIIKKAGLKAKIVEGGNERIVSVYNGLRACQGDVVITHDGARPLTPVWLINKVIDATVRYGAAVSALMVSATIKHVNGLLIEKSLPRETTWIAQTPQGFKRKVILEAVEKAIRERYFVSTDDSELVTRLGEKVRVISGDETNMKITFSTDIIIAEQLLKLANKNV